MIIFWAVGVLLCVCRLKKRSMTHGVQTLRGKMMSRRLLGLSHRELRSGRAWIFVPHDSWNERLGFTKSLGEMIYLPVLTLVIHTVSAMVLLLLLLLLLLRVLTTRRTNSIRIFATELVIAAIPILVNYAKKLKAVLLQEI